MDVPVRESGREAPRQHRRPAHTEEAPSGEPRRHRAPVSTPIPRSEGFRKKKTSEMTEEEKRAYRAEREARAAARKRERDRAARAAALVDIAGPAEEAPAENEIPASNAAPVISPTGMETVEITIDPMNTAPGELGVTEPAAQPQAEDSAREALQDLQLDEAGDQMNAAPAAAESFPAAEIPQPVEVEVPTPVPEVKPRPIDPASILQGDSELDALLTEIRGLLDEGPAVKAAPEAAGAPETAAPPLTETPAAPEAPSAPEPAADTAAAPEEAPAAPEAPQAEKELWLREEDKPNGEWTILDEKTGIRIVNRFNPAEVQFCYCNWNGAQSRVNLEEWRTPVNAKANEAVTLTNTYEIIVP